MNQLMLPDTIDKAISLALMTVAKSSQRVYQDTYNKWADWCYDHKVSPLDINPGNVNLFLTDHHVTRSTRRRQMSAMKKLLGILAINPNEPRFAVMEEFVKRMSVPEENISNTERDLLPLSPAETDTLLATFSGTDNISIRNRAMIAFLFATGVRRAECVVIEWRDIDLETGIAVIRHGKGDKRREVAIVGNYAINALKSWQIAQDGHRQYVFCPLDNLGRMKADTPMSPENLYRIIRQASKATGIDLSPHGCRRTHGTELFRNGSSMPDVKEQLGHARMDTTDRYAKAAGAEDRRKRFKTTYGDDNGN